MAGSRRWYAQTATVHRVSRVLALMFGTGRIERIVVDPTRQLLARLGQLPLDPRRVIWAPHSTILRHQTDSGQTWYRAPPGRASVSGRYYAADGDDDTIIVAQELPRAAAAFYTCGVALGYLASIGYLVGAVTEHRTDLAFGAVVAAMAIRLHLAVIREFEWHRFLRGLGQLG